MEAFGVPADVQSRWREAFPVKHMHASCLNPAALMELTKIPSHPSRREETASQRGGGEGKLQNRSWVSPQRRALVLLTWEDSGNELLSFLRVDSFCWRANPQRFWILRNTGAAGVPTAGQELALYALQPYLLCTWAAARPAPLTTPLTGNMCCQFTAEPSCRFQLLVNQSLWSWNT